ncbi:MAG: transposase, partial [Actinobacteria bacterium]|nr:transposase [Actinomycetota bacterium]
NFLKIFINDNFYHVFNRGVEKRNIFSDDSDRNRLLQTLLYYQFTGPKPSYSTHQRFKLKDFSNNPKVIEVACYCLMPNHFHLLLKQLRKGGVQEFVRKFSNSYTKYFNTKYKRVGSLFQGEFKSVDIETDEQLLHLSRYIHLNPVVSGLVKELKDFSFSSYNSFIGLANNTLCNKELILSYFKNTNEYKSFVQDQESYTKNLEKIKHLLIEDE